MLLSGRTVVPVLFLVVTDVYSCDTDSITTDCDLSKFAELMEKYMKDGCGAELGMLKNELNEKVKDKGFDVK